MTTVVRLTQEELVTMLRERFGDDPSAWAFRCPHCGDVATAADFRAALKDHPRTNRDGSPVIASDRLGQECIGRTLGALEGPARRWEGRGCDWVAYGLFRGPWFITTPEGAEIASFPVADPPEE